MAGDATGSGGSSSPVSVDEQVLREWASAAGSRIDFWVTFLNGVRARKVAEIGVYRGELAARLLADCAPITTYYMVDPWRHLEDWNKPANHEDDLLERFYEEAMERTSGHAEKRVVLRGRTSEVSDRLPDEGLDFVYVDGDHTLRGVTIDLLRTLPKVREGGWIAGDDFSPSIWQHGVEYEPTLVFPFAVHFAEAVGMRIYGLPRNQFLLEKRRDGAFDFVDLTGRYAALQLRAQLAARNPLQHNLTGQADAGGVTRRLRRQLRALRRRRAA